MHDPVTRLEHTVATRQNKGLATSTQDRNDHVETADAR
jgi:hypothetical protein